jgi:ATP adenylyltransferase
VKTAKAAGRKKLARKPASSKKSDSKSSGGRWPIEREILWRPHRLAYLQSQSHIKDCVFCDARSKGLKPDSLVIYDNGTSMVVLNKFPYNNGHILVLPTRHVPDLTDLADDEFSDIHKVIRMSVSALRKAYDKSPPGMNLGANLGSAAGAGHIIPRWIGDANFFPLVGQTKVISETLEQTYNRLLPYFE